MNIILACDDRFVPFCSVVVSSTLRFNDNIKFYIFTEGLLSENQNKLEKIVERTNSSIKFKIINKDIIYKLPLPKGEGLEHISIATYFRLFTTELLPDIDKAIYLDCDIVVRGSLQDLWNIEMSDNYLAAVYHQNILSINNGAFHRLNIPLEQGYFNAGVLLMNLKQWKKDDIYNKCMDFIRENFFQIRNHDQDVLNAVCGRKTIMLPCKWNMLNVFYKIRFWYKTTDPYLSVYQSQLKNINNLKENSIIVHFASRPKPWEWYCTHPLKNDFIDQLKENGDKINWIKWSDWKSLLRHIKATLMGYGRYNGKCYSKTSIWYWIIPILNCLTEYKKSKRIWN